MKPKWHMSRRTVLRGLGVSISLPFLEAMVKPGARAATANPYTRFLGMYGLSCGVVGKKDQLQGGIRVAPWTPEITGSISAVAPDRYLRPFFDQNLQSKITILTGLSDRQTSNHNAGTVMGSSPADAEANSVGPRGTADFVIQQALKASAPSLKHLVLSAAPTTGVVGVFRLNISFAPNQPLPVMRDPRDAFESVFAGAGGDALTEDSAEAIAAAARRKREDLSLLDSVRLDANQLHAKLGRADQRTLDEYLTGIREIEQRIQSVEDQIPLGCVPGGAPPPASRAYLEDQSKLSERLKLMIDIMVKAMECGKTRVGSLMFTSAYGGGYHPDYHGISHYISDAAAIVGSQEAGMAFMEEATDWSLANYAYLMAELDRRTDPDGATMLDNSILYFSSDHCDSHFHSSGSMPLILGGRGGRTGSGDWGIRAGRHVRYPPFEGESEVLPTSGVAPGNERSVRDLLWGIINHFGPEVDSFGDARSPLRLDWSDAVAS